MTTIITLIISIISIVINLIVIVERLPYSDNDTICSIQMKLESAIDSIFEMK